jgi:hypothetical protein
VLPIDLINPLLDNFDIVANTETSSPMAIAERLTSIVTMAARSISSPHPVSPNPNKIKESIFLDC